METDHLAQLITIRHDLLVELRRLAERQPDVIRAGEVNGLLGLLAAKQRVLNELLRVDRRLDPFREQDPEQRVWRTPADRELSRETARRCEQLLAEITRMERHCAEQLVERREQVAVLLQGLHGAEQASRAYGGLREFPGTQFDISSES